MQFQLQAAEAPFDQVPIPPGDFTESELGLEVQRSFLLALVKRGSHSTQQHELPVVFFVVRESFRCDGDGLQLMHQLSVIQNQRDH